MQTADVDAMMPHGTSLPLEGITMLDLTRFLPGALCTMLLRQLGARVIKVEDPRSGDPIRSVPPLVSGQEGALSVLLNRGKESVALDLKTEDGRLAFERLASKCDVVLDNFRPGVMERLGLDYARLQAINKRIVTCSLTGFGDSGAFRDKVAHDINYLALCGLLSQCGLRDGSPAIPGAQVADSGAALFAVMGILAAIVRRQATGAGGRVEVAMFDAALCFTAVHLARLLAGEPVAPRGAGRVTGGDPAYNVYRAADGRYLALGAIEHRFWKTFCEGIGREDLIEARRNGRDPEEVRGEVQRRLAERTSVEWCKHFEGKDVCLDRILDVDEVPSLVDSISSKVFVEGSDPRLGNVRHLVSPLRLSDAPPSIDGAVASLGQHTERVLAEIGYTAQQIETLRSTHVVRSPEQHFGSETAN